MRPFESASPRTIIVSTFTPRARTIWSLSPAACIAMPRFVRKNMYNRAPTATATVNASSSAARSRVATSQPSTLTAGRPIIRCIQSPAREVIVRSDISGTLLLPMMCRFTENSAVITRIPESNRLMPKRVWISPVIEPASAPHAKAAAVARAG
jgi:hypothetical protein